MFKIKDVAPFYRRTRSVRSMNADLFFSLLFLLALPVYYYGERVIYIALVAIASCVLSEMIFCLFTKQDIQITDLSSCVIGLTITMFMPVTIDMWIVVIACAFAILIGKMPFGGVGRTPFNPACVGVAFCIISFPNQMFKYVAPFNNVMGGANTTYQTAITTKSIDQMLKLNSKPSLTLEEILFGNVAGAIGTTAVVILIGCLILLLIRKAIRIEVPLAFLGSCAIYSVIFPRISGSSLESLFFELVSGSILFCAVFVATDSVTAPKMSFARIVYGLLGGLLTMIFRYYGAFSQGAVFAILFINALSPAIDKLCYKISEWDGGRS